MSGLYDLDVERAVLSTILFDPTLIDEISISIRYNTFYLPFHQYLFASMEELRRAQKPIDESFVRSALEREHHFDEVAMLDILSVTPLTNIKPYLEVLQEMSQKRGLVTLATEIKKEILEDDASPLDIVELTNKRVELIAGIGSTTINRKKMGDAAEGEPEFMVSNWLPIPKATISMIVAPGGTGKTWLILQLAIRMARENQKRKIFLWLSEDPEGVVKSRYNSIIDKILIGKRQNEDSQITISTEDPVLLLEGRGNNVKLSGKFYAIKRELREYDVIVIDPLLAFFGGDENDNSQARIFMQPFLNWARSENKTIIFLHHSKKGDGFGASRARGAGAIVDAVRCVYDMDKIYTSHKDEKRIDPAMAHMRQITLSKDNYGAIKHLKEFKVTREVTPQSSAPDYEIEYEMAESASMPTI